MKNRLILPLLSVLCLYTGSPVHSSNAQVTTHLDALPEGKATSPITKHTHTHRTPNHGKHRAPDHGKKSDTRHNREKSRKQETTPARKTEQNTRNTPTPPGYTTVPTVPPEAPPAIILPPPFVPVQKHPSVPPEEVTPVQNAGSQTISLHNQDLRVLFANNSTALDSITITSLHNFGITLAKYPEKRLVLKSYATLPGDDISMPRRIALARALAVRSILIHAGIATTRIYPIAYGRPDMVHSEGHDNTLSSISSTQLPVDRLDIIVEENPPATITPITGTPYSEASTPHTSPSPQKTVTTTAEVEGAAP